MELQLQLGRWEGVLLLAGKPGRESTVTDARLGSASTWSTGARWAATCLPVLPIAALGSVLVLPMPLLYTHMGTWLDS